VRELRNMTERAIILCKSNTLGFADFCIKSPISEIKVSKDGLVNLKALEIKTIRKALQNNNYNQQIAADILGITRDALARKLIKYNISISKSES
jgi:DNA-binding NtrC family response regulator